MTEESDIRELLDRARRGDSAAQASLFGALHDELRGIAALQMAGQPKGHTLQPTALVNEAYLRIFKGGDCDVRGRTHFVRLASRVMRQVLVDHARRRAADKREGNGRRLELDVLVDELERRSGGVLVLDEALNRLQARNPELVRLVELRFFGGRSMAEVGEALGVSERQALSLWNVARGFLRDYLEGESR